MTLKKYHNIEDSKSIALIFDFAHSINEILVIHWKRLITHGGFPKPS